jgi:type 1 fimbria pilin
MINTIRQVGAPTLQTKCCGIEPPADGFISIAAVARPGSLTFEHVITITLDADVTCDVNRIDLTLTPFGGSPAVSTTQPGVIGFDRCSTTGNSEWVYVWYEFATDPTGTQYDVEYELYDGQGVLILGVTSANKLNMP